MPGNNSGLCQSKCKPRAVCRDRLSIPFSSSGVQVPFLGGSRAIEPRYRRRLGSEGFWVRDTGGGSPWAWPDGIEFDTRQTRCHGVC
jgi:hypothetical protein